MNSIEDSEASTIWLCRGCGIRSAVTIKKGSCAYEGVEILRESHRRVSPDCPRNEQRIVGGRATEGEIADVMALPFVLDPAHPEVNRS